MPRLIVLESIEYYFAAVNELKLGEIKYEFSHISFEIENVFEILKKHLKVIIENYNQLKEIGKTKILISKEEERLKSYLLADLSYSSNLELDLKERIESFTSRINKIDSNKMIKRANKRKQLKWQLFDGIGELIFGLGIIGIGLLCAWLFSLKKDISNIPFEVFLILALVIVIILAFIIGLIVLLIKEEKIGGCMREKEKLIEALHKVVEDIMDNYDKYSENEINEIKKFYNNAIALNDKLEHYDQKKSVIDKLKEAFENFFGGKNK